MSAPLDGDETFELTRNTLRSTASRFIIPANGLAFAAQSVPPRKDCMVCGVEWQVDGSPAPPRIALYARLPSAAPRLLRLQALRNHLIHTTR